MMDWRDYDIIYPGRIVAYYPADQTADIKLCETHSVRTSNEDDLEVGQTILYQVPVHTASGGTWALTFPIKPGDTCLVCFSQIGYDHWLFEDKDTPGYDVDGKLPPWTYRRFDLSDGFAVVGFNTIPRAVTGYSATGSEWRNVDSSQMVALNEDGSIDIKAGSTILNLTKDGDVTLDVNTILYINGNVVISENLTVGGLAQLNGAMTAASSAQIQGALTAQAGADVTGTLTATTDVIGGGISLKNHTHPQGADSRGDSQTNTGTPL